MKDEMIKELGKNTMDKLDKELGINSSLQNVIWRCNEDITDFYGNVLFTKGLIYEQVYSYHDSMMLLDNNVKECEVYYLKDAFTSI